MNHLDSVEWLITTAIMVITAALAAVLVLFVREPRALCDDLDPFWAGELDEGSAEAFRRHLAGCGACANGLHDRMQRAAANHDERDGDR